MFRLQDNVPEIYVQASRDFQLFCRLYDAIQGGVKFSIDSLQDATSTKSCNASLLELLKTKLGLFTSTEVSEENMRLVLSAFPYIMRCKGSLRGVHYILNLFSRLTDEHEAIGIIDEEKLTTDHELHVTFPRDLKNDTLLIELLKLILPAGYMLTYAIAQRTDTDITFGIDSNLTINMVTKDYNSVYSADDIDADKQLHKNEVGTTDVYNSEEDKQT